MMFSSYLKYFIAFLCIQALSAEMPASSLNKLQEQVRADLKSLAFPPCPWKLSQEESPDILDVAIIGGGMAGQAAGLALIKEGIGNILIFDKNSAGLEGPWKKYARMQTLRSGKNLAGPAVDMPSLTFRAWYIGSYGQEAWQKLKLISTACWSEYLAWFRAALELPVLNDMHLDSLSPSHNCLELIFSSNGSRHTIFARKVVLATGREGFGGPEIPEVFSALPKKYYAHTDEIIDEAIFAQKEIVIVGVGASAFDAAAVALENGAKNVTLLARRPSLPAVNKFAEFSFPGLQEGFYWLSDEKRCQFFGEALMCGNPPPKAALERIKNQDNVRIRWNSEVKQVAERKKRVLITTSQGNLEGDFIILATGYAVNGWQRPELKSFMEDILLWKERCQNSVMAKAKKLGDFPYLGAHFQCLEKNPGQSPFLKHLYCFNYGAFLSHGLISGDIPGISVGAARLAKGITTDFFVEDCELYWQAIKNFEEPLFDTAEYKLLEMEGF